MRSERPSGRRSPDPNQSAKLETNSHGPSGMETATMYSRGHPGLSLIGKVSKAGIFGCQPIIGFFPELDADRLQCIALCFDSASISNTYRPTKSATWTCLLSRLINQYVKPDNDYVIASVNLEESLKLPLHFKAVTESTQAAPLLRQVYHYIQNV